MPPHFMIVSLLSSKSLYLLSSCCFRRLVFHWISIYYISVILNYWSLNVFLTCIITERCVDTSSRCYNTWWPQFCADYQQVREGCPQMCGLCSKSVGTLSISGVEIHSLGSGIRDDFVLGVEINVQNSGIHSRKCKSNHYFGVDSIVICVDWTPKTKWTLLPLLKGWRPIPRH